MQSRKNIYLVGPMAVGKTTVGRHLADMLGFTFIDADIELEARLGASIAWVFEKEGEAGFRIHESKLIEDLCTSHEGIVLATGGGAVLSSENRKNLHNNGCVVYLTAPLAVLLKRTAKDTKRPLLQTENPAAVLEKILNERTPLYQEVAHMVIPSDAKSAYAMAKNIFQQLHQD